MHPENEVRVREQYGMRRLVRRARFIASLTLVASCGSASNIATPSPVGGSPPPVLAASIAIEDLSASERFSGSLIAGSYWYRATFLLRETSGNSSATIQRVVVTAAGSTNDNGPSCWGDTPIRVPPGRTLDVFKTDAGLKVLGDYCAPYISSPVVPFQFHLIVTFRDDGGHEGSVETSATVTR